MKVAPPWHRLPSLSPFALSIVKGWPLSFWDAYTALAPALHTLVTIVRSPSSSPFTTANCFHNLTTLNFATASTALGRFRDFCEQLSVNHFCELQGVW